MMRMFTTWRRLKADTVNGDCIQLVITYSSFNKAEIDSLQEVFKQDIGAGLQAEYDTTPQDEQPS